jgi:hydrogenase maturation protein HypF
VHRLAQRHGITGWVRNGATGVTIEAEGSPGAVAAFHSDLPRTAPPIAVITGIEESPLPPNGDLDFRVIPSTAGEAPATLAPPDVATCAACLAELRDPADRRHRYPFLNCTDCGPRYTILDALPYDRVRTAMRSFTLCHDCQAEYEEIRNRRYHAEPIACPACGPHAWLTDPAGRSIAIDDPIGEAARRLAAGEIVAVKGLGGFHLACHPGDPAALARLRARKSRPDKPLAVMARDLAVIGSFAIVSEEETALLLQWRRPIVLLEPRPAMSAAPASENRGDPGDERGPDRSGRPVGESEAGGGRDPRRSLYIDPAVGGSARRIGAMLPYTPLHHLLLDGPCPVLVMTSGNHADEPIARDNDEALALLGGIADSFLLHDRPILNRADDSVVRVAGRRQILLRRSRGFAPQPVPLPSVAGGPAPCVIAVGGDLKGACCLIVRGEAFPGPHVGDLAHPKAAAFLVESMETLIRLLGARPEIVVHDLHPDYAGTAIATEFATRHGLRRLAVQHHQAHGLACLAENGRAEPAIVVALDGTGYGLDGTIWGGEVLVVDGPRFTRAACLRPRPLPGGDRAALEPWRMAFSVLREDPSGETTRQEPDGVECGNEADADPAQRGSVACARSEEMATGISRYPFPEGINPTLVAGVDALLRSPACPRTSSAGRLFDAAAAILGLRHIASFDGQAAMELEELAVQSADREIYPFTIEPGAAAGFPAQIDLGPTLRALWSDGHVPAADRARRFHTTLIEAVALTCSHVRDATAIDTVALSGGVFQNAIVLEGLAAALEARGFRVLVHERVPANDGGLALGQAWFGVLAGGSPPF